MEQDQKPQRVATLVVMDTETEELMVQHDELLQSGHEHKQGAGLVFARSFHAASEQLESSVRAFNRASL